jgi:D-alanyl-lipoteichoic acid acyltransferase DltB (MBOAT superfamily)
MALIGLWHGADWTFIIFGGFQGFLIILERTPLSKERKSSLYHKSAIPKILLPFFSFLFITISSILFRSQNIEEVGIILKGIFSFIPSEHLASIINKRFILFLFIMIALEVITRIKDFPLTQIDKYVNRPTRWIIYYILIFLIFRYAGPKEDFIYFQF